eukprot:Pompholyxophrys_punicea_v1_NODE_664_length_1495_cov_2.685417.p1 type:complete len:125 gc:universal NODE_664_length_1495_cov_2.685417:1024-1398(+)
MLEVDCNPKSIPAEITPLSLETSEKTDKVPYRETVSLSLALSTRPDIAYSVGVTARHSANLTKSSWAYIKRIFAYLKGSKEILKLSGPVQHLNCYVDSDLGGNPRNTKRSGMKLKRELDVLLVY